MQQHDRQSLLNDLTTKAKEQRQITIEKFQNTSLEILLKPSSSYGWSIMECLEHLNIYARYYLSVAENKMAESVDNLEAKAIKSTWIGRKAIEFMEVSKGLKKLKATKKNIPNQDLDARKVVTEFINQQERLMVILRKAETKDLQKIKIPISIAKFLSLNLGDMLQFLINHNERHILQATRNL